MISFSMIYFHSDSNSDVSVNYWDKGGRITALYFFEASCKIDLFFSFVSKLIRRFIFLLLFLLHFLIIVRWYVTKHDKKSYAFLGTFAAFVVFAHLSILYAISTEEQTKYYCGRDVRKNERRTNNEQTREKEKKRKKPTRNLS